MHNTLDISTSMIAEHTEWDTDLSLLHAGRTRSERRPGGDGSGGRSSSEVVGERLRVRLTRGWMPKGKAKASVYR